MLFVKSTDQACWVCGSREKLTGEHKIKKSDLKKTSCEARELILVRKGIKRPVQGINSELLKFKNSICATCNNHTTQRADYNYDEFRNQQTDKIKELLSGNIEEINIFELADQSSAAPIELARYFAKHIGCEIDYNKFPIPYRLSNFVNNKTNKIPITVSVRLAPFECKASDTGVVYPIDGIGGIALALSHMAILTPYCYETAYMTDGIQFIIKMPLNRLESLDISFFHVNKMGKIQHGLGNEAKHLGVYDDN